MSIRVGDFVTSCYAGYWQLIGIRPKIADEDYSSETVRYKKGDVIGQWVILKKAFTPKMKPKIEFEFTDASWLRPVSPEVKAEIDRYFAEHPDFKEKYDNAEIKIRPQVTNCWINLDEKEEAKLRDVIENLPSLFTMDDFWKKAKKFRDNTKKPPSTHILNFTSYPWDLDRKANLMFFGCELTKL